MRSIQVATGMAIKEFRKKAKLTQKQLQARSNLSQSCLSLWENGKRDPGAEGLIILAKIFGTKASIIIDRIEELESQIII